MKIMASETPNRFIISQDVLNECHKGFKFVAKEEISPARGFRELHDAVCEAFSTTDLKETERESVNNLINALQNLSETLAEQDSLLPGGEGYFVECDDLQNLVQNIGALGEAIRIHQTSLAHHDVAKAILWSKTALKKLVFKV